MLFSARLLWEGQSIRLAWLQDVDLEIECTNVMAEAESFRILDIGLVVELQEAPRTPTGTAAGEPDGERSK